MWSKNAKGGTSSGSIPKSQSGGELKSIISGEVESLLSRAQSARCLQTLKGFIQGYLCSGKYRPVASEFTSLELQCGLPTLQDGRGSICQELPSARGLASTHRPEACLFCHANPPSVLEVSSIHMGRDSIRIHLPAICPGKCSQSC